ncbi:MAG: HAD-IC family P-type ATPase, partial [Deltaproteobacteria bacterium]|nr:HAD-IC family P-type ATPase [Deltaproteobacteria bacterium]
ESWGQAQESMTSRGLRVLAVARRPLPGELQPRRVAEGLPQSPWLARQTEKLADQSEWDTALEEKLELLGLVGLEDPPRPEVAQAMAQCHQAGIRVVMCTGDHPHTALAIARETGLAKSDHPVVITGDRLKRLTHTQLELALDAPEVIFARVSAGQKLRIVAALQHKGEIVAVTGDGVNDAPALRKADIGIAMGLGGTDVAKAAADMVLLDDNFASIVSAVEEGRAVYDNIRRFVTYIATSNIPEIVPYLAYVLVRIPLPLTVIQILVVDLGTDMVPALGLGAEKPHPDTLSRPPRPRSQRLLDTPLLLRAYLFLGAMEAAAAMAAFFFVLKGGGWVYDQPMGDNDPLYLRATAATLAAIIAMQGVNVFLCRHERLSLFKTGIRGNRLIWWGIVVEWGLLMLVLYTPLGNRLFGAAPLGAEVWWFIAPFPAAMLLAEEARKWAARRLAPPLSPG